MRILFLGAGAVGGYFGGRMAEAGADVTFLVRDNRAQQLAHGLRIESPNGDANIEVNTITEGVPTDPFDVIVLTSKAYGLASALESIAPHVHEATIIAPLLNGIAHLAQIETRFPQAMVWGGVAQIPAMLLPDGAIRHMAPLQGLIFGPRPGQDGTREKAEQLVSIATKAGISARFSETIEQDLWDKWVFLATLAASTCLMRCDVGTILKADYGESFLLGLLDECTSVAAAEGFRPDDARMKGYHEQLTDRRSKWTASLLRDMEQGNRVEADHIVGDMIRRAHQHDIATPKLDIAWTYLQTYELSQQSERA